jgi:cold shock CspA family protein
MADENKGQLADKLKTHFERCGAKIDFDPEFQKLYNLDFMITRLENVHAHVNLGVHVTTSQDDLNRMQKFVQASQRGIVLKALYIEMSDVILNSGGFLVAFGACLSFLFDRRQAQSKALGMKIFEDCSYQFFELDETIQRLERMYVDDDLAIGDDLSGRIIAYFTDKGFGFIQTDDDRKYFFHIANVVDDELRARLPSYVLGEIIGVDFQYGGNDGKKYPKAINVSLAEDLNEDSDYYDDYDSEGYD